METLLHGMLGNAAAVTVLAALIAIAGRVSRRPALIHSVCLLAMLKLITPPVVSVAVPGAPTWFAASPAPVLPGPDDSPVAPEVADSEPAEMPTLLDDADVEWLLDGPVLEDIPATEAAPASWSWEAVALGLVLSGALAWWAVAAVRIVRFDRLLRDVEPMPAAWRDEVAGMAGRLGLRRPPSAYLVPGDLPPMLWAFGRRVRLLVPSRLWARLGDDERTALLLHELAHLRRRDHWVRWLELAVAGLYWWHPAVWWIRRALREAEEQCCDAWVVSAMPHGGARTYAAALVAALEFVSGARTAPAAAASATIGSGHVSSLKRRLRMIVRAKTPRGLSWAGRLAVAGLSALLLPLAPSWAEKEAVDAAQVGPVASVVPQEDAPLGVEGSAEGPDVQAAAAKLFECDIQLLLAQAAFEKANMQLARVQELSAAEGARRSQLQAAQLEDRIREEFQNDPALQPLIDQINDAWEALERNKDRARRGDEPAVLQAARQVKKLEKQWEELWQKKHDEIQQRLQAGGDEQRPEVLAERVKQAEAKVEQLKKQREDLKGMIAALQEPKGEGGKPKEARPAEKADEPKKGGGGGAATARIEQDLKDLKEKLGKDLDPVAEVVRKSLDRALGEIQEALKKEGMTAEDLRRAVEKARKDLHESLRRGGPVEKEMREAAERARKDMQGALEGQLKGALSGREEMKGRSEESRDQQKKQAEAMRDQMRKRVEQQRQANQERQALARREAERVREAARARVRRQPEDKAESRAKAEESPKAEDKPSSKSVREKAEPGGPGREELNAAREQIRELRERLREANSRLLQLERGEARRPEPPARPATPTPATPARPATPRRPATPAEPARPAPPRGAREGDDYDRRVRDLEDKMNRLLKELEEIKGRSTSEARSSSR